MKKIFKFTAFLSALLLCYPTMGSAQLSTHIKEVPLTSFNKIQVNLDTEVILLKSTRNQVTLVGDSTYIANLPVLVEDGKLEVSYAREPDSLLQKVLIEYTDLEHATTGGTGTYYFHKIKEDRLVVFNPYANVRLTGDARHIRIVSQEGVTDVRHLNRKEESLVIGEMALLVANQAQ